MEEELNVIPLEGTFTRKVYGEDGLVDDQPEIPATPAATEEPPPAQATKETPPVPEPTPEPPPVPITEPPVPTFEETFQSRFGIPISQVESIMKELEALKQRPFVEDPELVPDDDFTKDFIRTRKRGGDILKYLEARTTDFSKFSADEIVKYDIARREENKGAPASHLELEFQKAMRDLGKSEDMEPEDERKFTERLEWKAQQLREKHFAEMKKFQIPERQQPQAAEVPDTTEQIERNRRDLIAEPAVRDFMQSRKVAFGETEYSVAPENVIELLADFSKCIIHLQNPDGTINHSKAIKWAAYLTEMDAIDKAVAANVAAKQKLDIAKELKNPSDPAAVVPPPNGKRVVEWGV